MDLIDRQEAIEAIVKESHKDGAYGYVDASDATKVLNALPSAQPERLTDDDFETIRIHLSAYKEQLGNQSRWEEAEEYQRIIDRFMSFASAQPDLQQTCNQLATDCISRQAAYEVLTAYYHQTTDIQHNALHEALNKVPSEDAVAVIRCKDCTYYEPLENGYGICKDISGLGRWWKPDDFCSYGERVTDD